MAKRHGIHIVMFAFLVFALTNSSALAAWTTATMTNPGAESGSMTGWSTWDNRFIAANDSGVPYQGDWYFFSRASRSTSNGVSFDQTVDLSMYTGQILNVDVIAAYKYETGQRWGYDAQTNASYLYDWVGSLGMNAYSATGHLFGIGFELSPSDSWQTETIPCNLRLDWESKRDVLTRVNVQGKAMYMPVDTGSPGSWEIESWGAWVGLEPTFVGFDSFSVAVELVPEPATLGLLALGGLAMIRRRRRTA